MSLTLYKKFAWQTFASLRLFTYLVYVSTYCVPIAHLRQNKPFPLLYFGHAQITSHFDFSIWATLKKNVEQLWRGNRRVKEEKKNPQDKYYKLLNSLAAELSTKTPNKENVKEKLQDIDKRRVHGLLDSL